MLDATLGLSVADALALQVVLEKGALISASLAGSLMFWLFLRYEITHLMQTNLAGIASEL